MDPLEDPVSFRNHAWAIFSVFVLIPGLIIHLGIGLNQGYFWGKHRQTKYTREEFPGVFWTSVVAEFLLICLLTIGAVYVILDAYANG